METLGSGGETKQQQAQQPADDWSFLDGALDWEALLDEPILETVMEDTALDLSPHAFSGTTDSQRSQVRRVPGEAVAPMMSHTPTLATEAALHGTLVEAFLLRRCV